MHERKTNKHISLEADELDPSKDISIKPQIARMGTSATLTSKLKANELIAKGQLIYRFGLGESPLGGPQSIIDEIAKNAHRTSYLPTEGIPELRENISKFYEEYFDYSFNKNRVIVGPGSKELLFNSMQILDAAWLFISPSWVSYESQAKILDNQFWRVSLSSENNYSLTAKALKKRFNEIEDQLKGRPLAVLINYPNNPTGLTISNAEVGKIVRFARNNEIIILSDEIYANITHDDYPDKHRSFGVDYPEGTIVTGGVSKDRSMGGSRFGVAIMPEDQPHLIKAMKSVGSEIYTSVSAPIQYGMMAAYNLSQEVDDHIRNSTSIHSIIGTVVYDKLNATKFSLGRPEGAFYVMPSLNHYRDELMEHDINTGKQLADVLLDDYKIMSIPGKAFALSRDELSIRLAYIDYNGPNVLKEFQKNPDEAKNDPLGFVNTNCPSVIKGLEQLQQFSMDYLG